MKVPKLILAITSVQAAIRGAVSSTNLVVNQATTLEFDLDRWSSSGPLLK